MQQHFQLGDAIPDIITSCSNGNSRFHFSNAAGPYNFLCFYGSLEDQALLNHMIAFCTPENTEFERRKARLIGVSTDPKDAEHPLCMNRNDFACFLWDFDKTISKQFGCYNEQDHFQGFTLVLDPSQRVLEQIPLYPLEQHRSRIKWHLDHIPNQLEVAGFRI